MSTKTLVQEFGRLYREKVGDRYPPTWGRDMKIFKSLLEFYSEDDIKEFLALYFTKKSKIYSVPFFKVDIANLAQEVKADRAKNTFTPMVQDESWRFE